MRWGLAPAVISLQFLKSTRALLLLSIGPNAIYEHIVLEYDKVEVGRVGFRLWGTLIVIGLVVSMLVVQSLFGTIAALVPVLALGFFLLVKSFRGWDKITAKEEDKK